MSGHVNIMQCQIWLRFVFDFGPVQVVIAILYSFIILMEHIVDK